MQAIRDTYWLMIRRRCVLRPIWKDDRRECACCSAKENPQRDAVYDATCHGGDVRVLLSFASRRQSYSVASAIRGGVRGSCLGPIAVLPRSRTSARCRSEASSPSAASHDAQDIRIDQCLGDHGGARESIARISEASWLHGITEIRILTANLCT